MIELLRLLWKTLLEKDPPFIELFENYEQYHEFSHVTPMTELRIKLIDDWIRPGSKVLDVGCGEGVFMEYLAKVKKCDVYG